MVLRKWGTDWNGCNAADDRPIETRIGEEEL